MYTTFYGMTSNPFLKSENSKYVYKSNDFNEAISRFDFLKEVKGMGLFYGESGIGKTMAIRYFVNNLNKDLYKCIYISATQNMTAYDFYKSICNELKLNVDGYCRIDLYHDIQNELKRLVNKDKVQPIVIIDDAHLLSREILNSLKVLYDFEMDSKDYTSIIIIGHTNLKNEISKNIYESLRQRIITTYEFNGLSRDEVKEYVQTRLKLVNSNKDIFTTEAINALYSSSKSVPRRLNTLMMNSLILGAQNKMLQINSEVILNAKKEMEL